MRLYCKMILYYDVQAAFPCSLFLYPIYPSFVREFSLFDCTQLGFASGRSENSSIMPARIAENSNCIFMTLQNADICPSFDIFFPDIALFADLQVFSIRYDNYQYDSKFIIMVYIY